MSKRKSSTASTGTSSNTTTSQLPLTDSLPTVVTDNERKIIDGLLDQVYKQSSLPVGFEFDSFQKECWARLLKGRDLLVSLRTGGGKFLIAALAVLFCYFGVCFMFVPLDMLILEHEQSLYKLGIPEDRVLILTKSNMEEVMQQVLATKVGGNPLYVLAHPERFVEIFRKKAMSRCTSISVLIADEVQLVKEWGMGGFRVARKLFRQMREHHDKLRFVGFSGSLNGKQRKEVCDIVGIHPYSW